MTKTYAQSAEDKIRQVFRDIAEESASDPQFGDSIAIGPLGLLMAEEHMVSCWWKFLKKAREER